MSEKKVRTLNEFKAQVDAFDEHFLHAFNDIASLDEKYEERFASLGEEHSSYIEEYIASRPTIYQELLERITNHPIHHLYDDLVSSPLYIGVEDNFIPFIASNIDEARKILDAYLLDLRKVSSELNNYLLCFLKDISLDGENVRVGEDVFNAPNFPNFSFKDMTNVSPDYQEKVYRAHRILGEMENALRYIIRYYETKSFRKKVEHIADNAMYATYATLNKEKEDEALMMKCLLIDYYDRECYPFIKSMNDACSNYASISNFHLPNTFNEYVNVGYTPYELKNYDLYKERIKEIDSEGVMQKELRAPAFIDLLHKGNSVISTKELDDNINNFFYELILNYMTSFPLKKVHLALADVDTMDEFDLVMNFNKNYLRDNKLLVNDRCAEDSASLKEMLDTLARRISEVKGDYLAPNDYSSIFEYNKNHKNNSQDIYLFVYANCPKVMDEEIVEKLSNVLVNGPMCGVFSIILYNWSYRVNESIPHDRYQEFLNLVGERCVIFNYQEGHFNVMNERFIPHYNFKKEDLKDFFLKMADLTK